MEHAISAVIIHALVTALQGRLPGQVYLLQELLREDGPGRSTMFSDRHPFPDLSKLAQVWEPGGQTTTEQKHIRYSTYGKKQEANEHPRWT